MDVGASDLFLIEGTTWVVAGSVGSATYDFAFDRFFECRRPWQRPPSIKAIARVGAIPNYETSFVSMAKSGIHLINSPDQHTRASELPAWYPLIHDLTPRSAWFDEPPSSDAVSAMFAWPVFVKGARQTNRHRKDLSIANDPDEFVRILERYRDDQVLHWQRLVIREYVPLRRVAGGLAIDVPGAFEFRTFWLNGTLVGVGPYWTTTARYDWSQQERTAGLQVAQEAARRVCVPFLVVDLAQTADGRWIVIELNDAQEAGHAGLSPFALWQSVISTMQEADATGA